MRDAAVAAFLAGQGWKDAQLAPLAGDASARRYLRAALGGKTAVVMDVPPAAMSVDRFMDITRRLLDLGLSAPRILADNKAAGMLLLEDFGDDTYNAMLSRGADENDLYGAAIDVLIRKDLASTAQNGLPLYDDEGALEGVSRFTDWYAPAVLGQPLPSGAVEAFLDGWRAVMPAARGVRSTLTLFDFHVDNLMLLGDRAGSDRCGLLDYQDAVWAPVTFDLVSLLQDARRDVSPDLARAMLDRYLNAFPDLDRTSFDASYAVLGAQRATRIIGTFARLDRRDGKPGYLRHIARVWRWLEEDLRHPVLAEMKTWFEMHLPADRRVAPPPQSGQAA